MRERNDDVMRTLLIIIYAIVAVILTILTLAQSKEDSGVSGTIVGGGSDSFYDKNKGRTKEGKMKKLTIILGVAFIILAILLSIFY